jgi:hypothetical protein
MSFTTNVGAPEGPAPTEPTAATPDRGSSPASDTTSTATLGDGEVERRPGENPSEARARALGFMDEDDGEDGSLDASEDGADADDDVSAEGEAERFPWQRPEELSDDELAEWKEKQGLPQTEADYQIELPEGQEITDAGRPIVDSFLGFAVEHDLPEATVSKAIQWYNEHAVEMQAKRDAARKDGDKASKQAAEEVLQDLWEDQYKDNIAVATAGLETLPKSLQKALRAARGHDGRKLLHDPEMAQLLFDLGARAQDGQGGGGASGDGDDKALARQQGALRKELEAIGTLMRTDIEAYRNNPWKNTGKTAGERSIEIKRLLANPKSPGAQKAALRAERDELERLKDADPEIFEMGRWRGGKLTPAERLDQILTGLAG